MNGCLGLRWAKVALALGVAGCQGEDVYVQLVREPAACVSERCFVDPHFESEVEDFAAGVVADSLRLVYPLDGAVQPQNLADLTVQWDPAASGSSDVHLRLGEGERSYDFYVPCLATGSESARGCSYHLPRELFAKAARAFAGQRVTLALFAQGTDGRLLAAPPSELEFSAAPVDGALYYWARSGAAHSLLRAVFGAEGAVPLVTPPTQAEPNACGGCHAVSRDGSTLGYTLGLGDPDTAVEDNAAFNGSLVVAPASAPTEPRLGPNPSESDSAMMAFSHDGQRVVTAFDRKLVLRDAVTGAVLQELAEGSFGLRTFALFPEFSPDDSQLVVVLSTDPPGFAGPFPEIAVTNGRLAVLDVVDDQISMSARVLVEEADGLFHYYPTWSPDGRYLAFVSAPRDDVHDSYARSDGRLRLYDLASEKLHELGAASGKPGEAVTWPRFAPFFECPDGTRECPAEERRYFFTLSSKRSYGYVRLNGLEADGEQSVAQIWLSRLDAAALAQDRDPSSPPLWLPYQEPFQRNYQASWSQRAACSSDGACGPGAACLEGQCQTTPSR